MGLYDEWKQQQLQAEASKRGLSAGGSNAELVARLEEHDADQDLLGLATGEPTAAPVATPPAAVPPAVDPDYAEFLAWKQNKAKDAAAAETARAAIDPTARSYIARYPVRGELSTSMNEDNRMRAYQEAIDAGLAPRGGMAGVCRIGWEHGQSIAVYEVILQRQRAE